MTAVAVSDLLPFYKERIGKKVKQGTLRNYVSALGLLNEVDLDDPDSLVDQMNDVIEIYYTEGNSGNVKMCAYLNFLRLYGLDTQAKKLEWRQQNLRRISKKWISKKQIESLIIPMKEEMKLITLLMFETCSRISEILAIKRIDLSLETKQVFLTSEKIVGKTSNPEQARRTMTLSDDVLIRLKSHLETVPQTQPKIFNIPYISAWRQFKKAGKESLGTEEITPHWMRASCAVYLLQKGYDLMTIAEYGGWQTLAALKLYLTASGITSEMVMKKEQFGWD